ncbi:hypothetical protein MMC24_006585 [Lignoscripta atroalba]|nr:hypothetical protein [Lignoscripta atroalba]
MHHAVISLFALLCAASTTLAAPEHYYARAPDAEPDVRTGDVIAHITENEGNINWKIAPDGSKVAWFPNDVWNPAVATVVRKLKAKRELEHGTSPNELDARGEIFKRADELKAGIDDGKGKKKAFFDCYNSGQKAYDATMSAIAGTGCGILMEGVITAGVHVWVSKSFWTPDRKVAKLFLTWTGKTLSALSASECAYAVTLVVKEFCQLDEKTTTQGGKLTTYANPVGSIFSGDATGELKVDPNACSKDIPCEPVA